MATSQIKVTAVQGLIYYELSGGVKRKIFVEISKKSILADIGAKTSFVCQGGACVNAGIGKAENNVEIAGAIRKVPIEDET